MDDANAIFLTLWFALLTCVIGYFADATRRAEDRPDDLDL